MRLGTCTSTLMNSKETAAKATFWGQGQLCSARIVPRILCTLGSYWSLLLAENTESPLDSHCVPLSGQTSPFTLCDTGSNFASLPAHRSTCVAEVQRNRSFSIHCSIPEALVPGHILPTPGCHILREVCSVGESWAAFCAGIWSSHLMKNLRIDFYSTIWGKSFLY